ncbi:hypothetical protein F5Y00DRAFT_134509 [Daldinia vernicosa]|uniref:uncharacterized protein n=1 Tax=Daldinia vernicosa TaxID=114800 RepID=UPI002008A024|nr:uncharacterized protein F5Y00DRAFT_134509 [Daldinia vernicosa]KAI0853192.1 hypothetical protein F5Y00DRAFT_134509 [Daldinia vernicosa]
MSSSSSIAVTNSSRHHVRSRTQSISSDRPSTAGHNLMSPPLSVSPEAVFIAASAASQIVTNDHDSHSEIWYDQMGIGPSEETALVSPGALQLANNFVDQLLFNIISVAKSTSLSALRPAVSEVLKPKLAKDAINNADEELREYLGGGEIDDLVQSPNTEAPVDWDLELVWKRTRLRCMVYSSLGDMEEEDEDYYMEQEHLRGESDDIMSDVVSPAVAIFLTSIVEFMGEQVLVIAGQAAFNRLRVKCEKELKEGTRARGELFERLVVEELDMERVALDRTLGRLWRAWKKKIRSPGEPNYSRPFSRSSSSTSGVANQRRGSAATDHVQLLRTPRDSDPALGVQEEQDGETAGEKAGEKADQKSGPKSIPKPDPAEVPLPDSDVEAIYSDEESEEENDFGRPKSLILLSSSTKDRLASLRASLENSSIRRVRSLPSRKRPRYPSTPGASRRIETPPHKDTSKDKAETMDGVSTKDIGHDNINENGQPNQTLGQKAISDGLIPVVNNDITPAISRRASSIVPLTEIEEDEIEEFTEEPKILTSSRISIGGRSSSPSTSDSGRPTPLMPVRTSSIHSVRIIEVQSPRSPTAGSRTSSMDFQDPALVARRISTPPIVEENDSGATPEKKHAVILQRSFDDSQETSSGAVQPARNPSPLRSVHSQEVYELAATTTTTTKVSILSGPTTEPPLEEKPVAPLKSSRNMPMPTLLERSTSRPIYGRSSSNDTASNIPARRGTPESPKMPRSMPSDSPSSTSAKFKAVRTSEDGSPRRSEDRARDFEQLIHSQETLQYTLTPENMRDIDSSSSQHTGSPKPNRFQRSEDTRQTERSRSSSIKRTASFTKQTNLGSNPLGSHPPTDLPFAGKFSEVISNAPASIPPKSRSGMAAQAREARVAGESLQDFANFIRSTGPPGERTVQHSRGHAASISTIRGPRGPTHVKKSASIDSRQTSSSNRSHFQARDATVNLGSENSDLIDFIRRGPPSTNANNPRIPRHVAPFRSTMDSDQLQMAGAVGGKAIDAVIPNIRNSETSTNVTEASAPSSMNSQSALLSKMNKAQQYSGNNFDDDDMIPKRTQRRVRDPYAIDFSDEEDEELDIMPQPKPKKEESLIDFLNSYPPPPEPMPQPVAIPKKKSSAPNLIARLRSGGGSIRSASNPRGFGADSRSLSSRAGTSRGYTPIVIPTSADTFGSNPRPPPTAPSSSMGRVPMKKFEARDAVSANTHTSDLASFLRDSEPPPQPVISHPAQNESKSSGFSRMFERRKKSTAY